MEQKDWNEFEVHGELIDSLQANGFVNPTEV